MLIVNHLIGFGGAPSDGAAPPAAFDLTQVAVPSPNTAAQASYTFSDISTGAVDASRRTIIGVACTGENETIPTVTVDGNAATSVAYVSDTPAESATVGLWIIDNFTGTDSDIVVTWGVSEPNTAIVLWRLVGVSTKTAFASGTANSTVSSAMTINLQIPSGGGGLALAVGNNPFGGARTWTWTGLTESTDAVLESGCSYSSALSLTAGTADRKAQASGTVGAGRAMVAASWAP